MPKMIPHRLIHKKFEEHELIKTINKETGRSLLDEDFNMIDIECEAFHIFPLSLQIHPVVQVLSENHKLSLESDDNIVYLPLNPIQAYKLSKSAYADPPIDSYIDGVTNVLDNIAKTITFTACKAGDEVALNTIRDHLTEVRTAMKDGLENGKLFAAFGYTDDDYKRDEAMWSNMTKQ